ncbi:hypothetical protein RYX36_013869 [Vicia faba]
MELIVKKMVDCRDNKKIPLFYSSFVQQILKINGIMPKDGDINDTSKILDYGGVSKMRRKL